MTDESISPFVGQCVIHGLDDRLVVYPDDEQGRQSSLVVVVARYAMSEIGVIVVHASRDLLPKERAIPVPHNVWIGLNQRLLGTDVEMFVHEEEGQMVRVLFKEEGVTVLRRYVTKRRNLTGKWEVAGVERKLAWHDATHESITTHITELLSANVQELEAWRNP